MAKIEVEPEEIEEIEEIEEVETDLEVEDELEEDDLEVETDLEEDEFEKVEPEEFYICQGSHQRLPASCFNHDDKYSGHYSDEYLEAKGLLPTED